MFTRLQAHLRHAGQTLRFDLLRPVKAHARRLRKARELKAVIVRSSLRTARIVAVMVVRDEAPRLAYFLQYYRALGVDHFLVIDNQSADGTRDILTPEADVSVYEASGEYGRARYGNAWVNAVLNRHCRGKWILYVDADEHLVFAGETCGLRALCDALESGRQVSLSAVMVDMYSDRSPRENLVVPGTDPLLVCPLYDGDGYFSWLEHESGTVWVKGGVRRRLFFPDDPMRGPALNKTPLVRWRRRYAFFVSAHVLWPRRLNAPSKDPKAALLHFRFTADGAAKLTSTDLMRQHTPEYDAYSRIDGAPFRGPDTRVYRGPDALVEEGIISAPGLRC